MFTIKSLPVFALMVAVLAMSGLSSVHARDGQRERIDDDPHSLASPNYEGYRPDWANPYAEPEDLGVNDDPTPFNPADVDSGPSPLEPNAF